MKKYRVLLACEVELQVKNETQIPEALEFELEFNETPTRFLDSVTIIDIETGKKYTRKEIAEIFEIKEELN